MALKAVVPFVESTDDEYLRHLDETGFCLFRRVHQQKGEGPQVR